MEELIEKAITIDEAKKICQRILQDCDELPVTEHDILPIAREVLETLLTKLRDTEGMLAAATRIEFDMPGTELWQVWRAVRHEGNDEQWTAAKGGEYTSHPDAITAYHSQLTRH